MTKGARTVKAEKNTNGSQEAAARWRVPHWLATAVYLTVAGATVALLIAHTLKWDCVRVDTTTLGLLVLLLLVPLAPYITRVSAAGIEAEIGPRDVRGLRAAAADLPPASAQEKQLAGAGTVMELIEADPPLGLARLRMDLEREVRQLYERHVPNAAKRGRSLGMMVRELSKEDALPTEVVAPLMDVTALANRAIHGDYVPTEVAEDIGQVGIRVLSTLSQLNESEQKV